MRPDKSLGQHFLRDPEVLADIAAVADLGHASGGLEIGPGEGALTAFLVQHASAENPLVAIDLDPRALAEITERFGDRVKCIHGDAAQTPLGPLLPGPRACVVGNLPYNAATAIYRQLIGLGPTFARAVMMFQKEVAERIVAGPGSRAYGMLSILTALRARAWIIRNVPPRAFTPPPKVDSAIILMEPLPHAPLTDAELPAFTDFVGQVFAHRRKTITNAIAIAKSAQRLPAIEVSREDLAALGIDPRWRAEQIPAATILAWFRHSRRP